MSSDEVIRVDGYFGFKPNLGLEIAAITVYAILTVIVFYLNVKKRTFFMMPIVVGGALEIFGFAWRIWETSHFNSEAGYILYLVPVLVAPTVLAAADYSLASVVMSKGNVRIPFFTPKVTKYLFLVCDIAAFFIQGLGGSVAASAKTISVEKTGSNIVLGGLAISLAVFLIFLLLSLALQLKIHRQHSGDKSWMRIFYVVYVNMLCLSIRAFYRVAEFRQGSTHNKLSIDEAYFYTLDVLLMMILMFTWIPFHPSTFGLTKDTEVITPLPTDEKTKGAKETELKEVKEASKEVKANIP